jgi:YcaO-like protein with predicted kinase domain
MPLALPLSNGMMFGAEGPGLKLQRPGIDRTVSPEETIDRIRPLFPLFGITRLANLTGLDHVGVPVTAAVRPNGRAVAVSQGKGLTLAAAKASAAMEAIEMFHAERMSNPLRAATLREMLVQPNKLNLEELPRTRRTVDLDTAMLWTAATDLLDGRDIWVPWEVVHTDHTIAMLGASGRFLCSSNGLASGNHPLEAISHGICEVIERDANALFQVSSSAWKASRRIDVSTVESGPCREVLDLFERADVATLVWDATTDVGVPSFICRLADRRERGFSPVIPISGSGCHPHSEIALLRALTEAAQGRVTRISGARDDLDDGLYNPTETRAAIQRFRADASQRAMRSFAESPGADLDTLRADVEWELGKLDAAGLHQVVVVDLTREEIGVPVMRIIVPGLEGPHEIPGRIAGARQARWQRKQAV